MVDSAPRTTRVPRALLVVGVVLAALVPGALWWVGHGAVLDVSASTGIPRCEGTELTTTREGGGFEREAIPMTRGFTCTLTIQVGNHSDREVRVTRLSIPVGGPGARSGYRVTHIGGLEVPADGRVEAVVGLERSLSPGADALVAVRVVFRPSGCASKGSALGLTPTVEVDALLASRAVTIADAPRFLGTADSSCDT